MFAGLQSDRNFPFLAQLMLAVRTGGALPPIPFPPTDGLVTAVSQLNATTCNDINWPRSVAEYTKAVARNRAEFPLTAGMPMNIRACAFWPTAATEAPVRVTPNGPSNVLLIQDLRDPSTPYSASLKMREAFGNRARLVTVDAGGHDAYLANGNACGDATVTAFLTDGTRPAHDITCR
jgi:pimeloyl-ACP methyl ester carboxylesterase